MSYICVNCKETVSLDSEQIKVAVDFVKNHIGTTELTYLNETQECCENPKYEIK